MNMFTFLKLSKNTPALGSIQCYNKDWEVKIFINYMLNKTLKIAIPPS